MTNYLPGGMGGKDMIVVTPGPLLQRLELEHCPDALESAVCTLFSFLFEILSLKPQTIAP